MQTKVILENDINQLIAKVGLNELMDQMTRRLEKALREFDSGDYELPARDGFNYNTPQPGLIEWMPVMKVADKATIKVVGYHPQNPSTFGLPTILSTVGLYDLSNGHMSGLADATFLTALRTAAASTIASQLLASKDARVIGLIGAGAQAVAQLHGLSRQFAVEQVLIHDVNPGAVKSFANRMQGLIPAHIKIRQAPVNLLVQSVDILCTCTSIDAHQGPLFEDCEVKSGLHINAIGADFPGKTELPLSLLRRSLVVPDFTEQAVREGECQQLKAAEIGADLTALLKQPCQTEQFRQQLSVFDSTGYALEDQVAMEMLLEYCDDLSLGLNVQLETATGDPLNPYDFNMPDQIVPLVTGHNESI